MASDVDLFGEPIDERRIPPPPGEKKRRKTVPKGYAAPPGTGPKGETCRTCKFYARISYAKTYCKCAKVEGRWTNGPGTDILARAAACHYWESAEK